MTHYEKAHRLIEAALGKAREYPCALCGRAAEHWAYLYTDPDALTENGRPFSLDLKHYAPMCRGCHRRYDLDHDPVLAEKFRELGRQNAHHAYRGIARRRETDPEFVRREAERLRALVTPEIRSAGGKAAADSRRKDPEKMKAHQERGREIGRKLSQQRRECECGMVSNPGAIARHLKKTGHRLTR